VQLASEFWQTRVFVKTYRERRSALAIYRAFYRCFMTQMVAYHFLQVRRQAGCIYSFAAAYHLRHMHLRQIERHLFHHSQRKRTAISGWIRMKNKSDEGGAAGLGVLTFLTKLHFLIIV
jgi:hypothetical protein